MHHVFKSILQKVSFIEANLRLERSTYSTVTLGKTVQKFKQNKFFTYRFHGDSVLLLILFFSTDTVRKRTMLPVLCRNILPPYHINVA